MFVCERAKSGVWERFIEDGREKGKGRGQETLKCEKEAKRLVKSKIG